MKIEDAIKMLEAIKTEHGNLDITIGGEICGEAKTKEFRVETAKALADYGQIDPKFFESDLEGVHRDAVRMIMWIYSNKDNTFTVELEVPASDEEQEDCFKAFEDGMDVNALIEDGLAFFDGTVGRTRIYPATIEEYHDCGTIGSLTFFCDRKVS